MRAVSLRTLKACTVPADPPYLIVSGAFLVGSNVLDALYVSIDKQARQKGKNVPPELR
jgi:hypothetical protein